MLQYMCQVQALETIENLLYICDNYRAKIWALASQALTLDLFQHMGEYVQAIILTPLEIVFNKPHPFRLLHLQDSNMQKCKK